MKKIIGLALVGVIALFGLTACGGYDDSNDGDSGISSIY